MAASTAPVSPLTPAELDDRRLAVENAIGTMRIEDLEPDEATQQILFRYGTAKSSYLRPTASWMNTAAPSSDRTWQRMIPFSRPPL